MLLEVVSSHRARYSPRFRSQWRQRRGICQCYYPREAHDTRGTSLSTVNSSTKIHGPQEIQFQWRVLTLFLAAFASACAPTNFDPSGLTAIIAPQFLPDEMRVLKDPSDLAETFIISLIDLIVADSVHARDVARDALGSELSPRVYPILFRHFSEYVSLSSVPLCLMVVSSESFMT